MELHTMAQSTHRLADASQKILIEIERRTQHRQAPVLIVFDGGSGAGKSTVAAMVGQKIHAVVVPLDDFFAAHIPDWQWKALSIAERATHVFDWQRLRAHALEPLLANRSATWYPFDFAAGLRPDGTYALSKQSVERPAALVIILDGAYSASPAVEDLIDLTVLVDVPVAERHKRLAQREDEQFLQRWHAVWDDVETYYFTEVRPEHHSTWLFPGSRVVGGQGAKQPLLPTAFAVRDRHEFATALCSAPSPAAELDCLAVSHDATPH
jgi:uridine kinase